MAITPEIEPKVQTDVLGEQQPELTPRADVPQPPENLQGYIKPVTNDQPQQVVDDQGQPILNPAYPILFQTAEELKEAEKAPPSEGKRWLAVFAERLAKMRRIVTKILFPTSGWSQKQMPQEV